MSYEYGEHVEVRQGTRHVEVHADHTQAADFRAEMDDL